MRWVFFLALLFTLGAAAPLKLKDPRLIVHKKERRLELHDGATLVRSYRIGLGLKPDGTKKKQGDYATPEGEYRTCAKHPKSQYFMALKLNYPNAADADRGLKDGLISKKEHAAILAAAKAGRCPPFHTKLGGEIELHGMGSQSDWTWGCIALENPDIEELYKSLPNGTPVTIKP
ncbi:MAG: L,D-transpeptidase [Elusimicrobia bacterium]|nr:L,D-transpeptidase [Elusimicrobiota bacterium]